MQLLIIRHAIAVARGTPGIGDDERPLSEQGRRCFGQCARGIARLVERPDALLTSPWLRARQTAGIMAAAWGRCEPAVCPALAGGAFEDQAAVVDGYAGDSTVAIVGHEPFLSALLTRLLRGAEAERLAFKKGGAALVDLPGRMAEGGSLRFFLPPKALEKIA